MKKIISCLLILVFLLTNIALVHADYIDFDIIYNGKTYGESSSIYYTSTPVSLSVKAYSVQNFSVYVNGYLKGTSSGGSDTVTFSLDGTPNDSYRIEVRAGESLGVKVVNIYHYVPKSPGAVYYRSIQAVILKAGGHAIEPTTVDLTDDRLFHDQLNQIFSTLQDSNVMTPANGTTYTVNGYIIVRVFDGKDNKLGDYNCLKGSKIPGTGPGKNQLLEANGGYSWDSASDTDLKAKSNWAGSHTYVSSAIDTVIQVSPKVRAGQSPIGFQILSTVTNSLFTKREYYVTGPNGYRSATYTSKEQAEAEINKGFMKTGTYFIFAHEENNRNQSDDDLKSFVVDPIDQGTIVAIADTAEKRYSFGLNESFTITAKSSIPTPGAKIIPEKTIWYTGASSTGLTQDSSMNGKMDVPQQFSLQGNRYYKVHVEDTKGNSDDSDVLLVQIKDSRDFTARAKFEVGEPVYEGIFTGLTNLNTFYGHDGDKIKSYTSYEAAKAGVGVTNWWFRNYDSVQQQKGNFLQEPSEFRKSNGFSQDGGGGIKFMNVGQYHIEDIAYPLNGPEDYATKVIDVKKVPVADMSIEGERKQYRKLTITNLSIFRPDYKLDDNKTLFTITNTDTGEAVTIKNGVKLTSGIVQSRNIVFSTHSGEDHIKNDVLELMITKSGNYRIDLYVQDARGSNSSTSRNIYIAQDKPPVPKLDVNKFMLRMPGSPAAASLIAYNKSESQDSDYISKIQVSYRKKNGGSNLWTDLTLADTSKYTGSLTSTGGFDLKIRVDEDYYNTLTEYNPPKQYAEVTYDLVVNNVGPISSFALVQFPKANLLNLVNQNEIDTVGSSITQTVSALNSDANDAVFTQSVTDPYTESSNAITVKGNRTFSYGQNVGINAWNILNVSSQGFIITYENIYDPPSYTYKDYLKAYDKNSSSLLNSVPLNAGYVNFNSKDYALTGGSTGTVVFKNIFSGVDEKTLNFTPYSYIDNYQTRYEEVYKVLYYGSRFLVMQGRGWHYYGGYQNQSIYIFDMIDNVVIRTSPTGSWWQEYNNELYTEDTNGIVSKFTRSGSTIISSTIANLGGRGYKCWDDYTSSPFWRYLGLVNMKGDFSGGKLYITNMYWSERDNPVTDWEWQAMDVNVIDLSNGQMSYNTLWPAAMVNNPFYDYSLKLVKVNGNYLDISSDSQFWRVDKNTLSLVDHVGAPANTPVWGGTQVYQDSNRYNYIPYQDGSPIMEYGNYYYHDSHSNYMSNQINVNVLFGNNAQAKCSIPSGLGQYDYSKLDSYYNIHEQYMTESNFVLNGSTSTNRSIAATYNSYYDKLYIMNMANFTVVNQYQMPTQSNTLTVIALLEKNGGYVVIMSDGNVYFCKGASCTKITNILDTSILYPSFNQKWFDGKTLVLIYSGYMGNTSTYCRQMVTIDLAETFFDSIVKIKDIPQATSDVNVVSILANTTIAYSQSNIDSFITEAKKYNAKILFLDKSSNSALGQALATGTGGQYYSVGSNAQAMSTLSQYLRDNTNSKTQTGSVLYVNANEQFKLTPIYADYENDPLKAILWNVNSGTFGGTAPTSFSTAGNYNVGLKQQDNTGDASADKWSNTAIQQIVVGNAVPVPVPPDVQLNIIGNADNQGIENHRVDFTITGVQGTDAIDWNTLKITLDDNYLPGGQPTTKQFSRIFKKRVAGDNKSEAHTIKIDLSDVKGRKMTTKSFNFTIIPDQPPIAGLTITGDGHRDSEGEAYFVFTSSAQKTDDDISSIAYMEQNTDGSWTQVTLDGSNRLKYNKPGKHKFKQVVTERFTNGKGLNNEDLDAVLTSSDFKFAETAPQEIEVINVAPTLTYSVGPTYILRGSDISHTSSVTDDTPFGDVQTYRFVHNPDYFKNNKGAHPKNGTSTDYPLTNTDYKGSYTFYSTVTDEDGAASAEVQGGTVVVCSKPKADFDFVSDPAKNAGSNLLLDPSQYIFKSNSIVTLKNMSVNEDYDSTGNHGINDLKIEFRAIGDADFTTLYDGNSMTTYLDSLDLSALNKGKYEVKFTVSSPQGFTDTISKTFTMLDYRLVASIDPTSLAAGEDLKVTATVSSEALGAVAELPVGILPGGAKYINLDLKSDDGTDKIYEKVITVPNTFHDGIYTVVVSGMYPYNLELKQNFSLTVNTPINLVPHMPSPVYADLVSHITANTTKYANATTVNLFAGTAYATGNLSMTGVINGNLKDWSYDYPVPNNIPEGTYNAIFTATTLNGNTETVTVPFNLVTIRLYNFRITSITDLQFKNNVIPDYPLYIKDTAVDQSNNSLGILMKRGYGFFFDIDSIGLSSADSTVRVRPRFFDSVTSSELDMYYISTDNKYVLATSNYGSRDVNDTVRIFFEKELLNLLGYHNEIFIPTSLRSISGGTQTWFGKYGIPPTAIFVNKGDNPAITSRRIKNPVIINFEIDAMKNGVSVFNYIDNGQWMRELKDAAGHPFNPTKFSTYQLGDVILIDPTKSIDDDYDVITTH